MPIDLAQNRSIVFHVAGHEYTLVCSSISKAQWLKYYAGIESTSENVQGNRIESFDSSGARLQLVTDTLIDAQGYRVGGSVQLKEVKDWQQLIPASHRLSAGNMLISVERSADEDTEPALLGCEVVRLDALWGSGPKGMTKYVGLKHAFYTPTVEQQRRYNRDMSRSQIIGGSRTGKTRWMGAQATLVELYDELITAVDGYSFDGQPLDFDNPNRETIIRNMDTHHKVVAAEALFSPIPPTIADAKKENA